MPAKAIVNFAHRTFFTLALFRHGCTQSRNGPPLPLPRFTPPRVPAGRDTVCLRTRCCGHQSLVPRASRASSVCHSDAAETRRLAAAAATGGAAVMVVRNLGVALLLGSAATLAQHAPLTKLEEDTGRRAKGIYGATDNRLDESASSGISAALRTAALSTVALVPKAAIVYNAGTNTWGAASTVQTLQASYSLCATDATAGGATAFKDQLTPSSCSGTVVEWDATTKTGRVATVSRAMLHATYSSTAQSFSWVVAGGLWAEGSLRR
jgi:hypothetical protein